MNYDDYILPGATNRFDGQDYPPGRREQPEMAQATVIEPDDVFDTSVAIAEAFQEYDFADLTAKQIKNCLITELFLTGCLRIKSPKF